MAARKKAQAKTRYRAIGGTGGNKKKDIVIHPRREGEAGETLLQRAQRGFASDPKIFHDPKPTRAGRAAGRKKPPADPGIHYQAPPQVLETFPVPGSGGKKRIGLYHQRRRA